GSKFWNWQASTFTAISGAATDLTPTLNTGVYSYTTSYFQINTGTGAWENGRSYVVHELATDKAGNTNDIAHAAFTFDIKAPTATIQIPLSGLPGIKNLPSISGIATDDHTNNMVNIAIYSPTDGAWFDGSGFNVTQSTPYFVATSTSVNAT